jgi:hypothetical protein
MSRLSDSPAYDPIMSAARKPTVSKAKPVNTGRVEVRKARTVVTVSKKTTGTKAGTYTVDGRVRQAYR